MRIKKKILWLRLKIMNVLERFLIFKRHGLMKVTFIAVVGENEKLPTKMKNSDTFREEFFLWRCSTFKEMFLVVNNSRFRPDGY